MSFSGELKQEIFAMPEKRKCCQKAELFAMLCFSDAVLGKELTAESERAELLKRCAVNIRHVFGLKDSVHITEEKGRAVLRVDNQNDSLLILDGLCLLGRLEQAQALIRNECCKRALVRGAFLAAGTVSDPESSYHLEVDTKEDVLCRMLCEALEGFQLHPKISMRRGRYVIYLKDSEEIQDALRIIGAYQGLMQFLNAKILKTTRNNINRAKNCEVGNIGKATSAGVDQKRAILRLKEQGRYTLLSDSLREIAELRLTHPEASLIELGNMAVPPLSKSCVNHRMRKIVELAKEK